MEAKDMTAEEIIKEIRNLPVEEQLNIAEMVLEALEEAEDQNIIIDAPPFLSLAGILKTKAIENSDENI